MDHRASRWRLAMSLGLFSALGAGAALPAATVRIAGVRFDLPSGWREVTPPDAATHVRSERLWVLGAAASPEASLLLTLGSGPTEVSAARLQSGRRELERQESIALESLRVRGQGEDAAYELVATSATDRGPVRHVQYLLQGRRSVSVTISAPAARFSGLRPELERLADSLAVEEGPSPWHASPPSLCGAALVVLLSLCALLRVFG